VPSLCSFSHLVHRCSRVRRIWCIFVRRFVDWKGRGHPGERSEWFRRREAIDRDVGNCVGILPLRCGRRSRSFSGFDRVVWQFIRCSWRGFVAEWVRAEGSIWWWIVRVVVCRLRGTIRWLRQLVEWSILTPWWMRLDLYRELPLFRAKGNRLLWLCRWFIYRDWWLVGCVWFNRIGLGDCLWEFIFVDGEGEGLLSCSEPWGSF